MGASREQSSVVDLRTQDDVNRPVWDDSPAAFEDLLGWLDRGEAASLLRVADEVRGLPVLDLGVGTGRTTSLLRLLSSDYVGVDYTRSMVEASQGHFPGERFVLGDARDLSEFPASHFALVLFSFNGIDAVDHAGRERIIQEVRRVLRPGGYFIFNTHNYDGPSFGDRPWNLRPLTPLPKRRAIYNVVRRVAELPFSTPNYRKLQALSSDEGTYALRPSASHRFGIVVYFAKTEPQVTALRAGGFERIEIYTDLDGRLIDANDDTQGNVWLYFVAQTPM